MSAQSAPVAVPSADECKVLGERCLAGRSALVTGAGTGIGQAVALRLAELGAHVTGVGRRVEPLAETARLAVQRGLPGTVETQALDVRDGAATSALIAALGAERGIDLLVNNAGGQFVAPAATLSPRGMAAVLDLNLTAVARLIALARPYLRARGGTVVTISLSAPQRGIPALAHSATARAAIVGLTRRLAGEWAGDGITLHCLAPGTVLTAGVREELTPEALARALAATPLGRDTTLPEVAEWVAALAAGVGPARGALLELDGGAGLRGAAGLLA
jgi:citronellol/citronellal dehydrogenase